MKNNKNARGPRTPARKTALSPQNAARGTTAHGIALSGGKINVTTSSMKIAGPVSTRDLVSQLYEAQTETHERISVLKDRLAFVLVPESLGESVAADDPNSSELDGQLRDLIRREGSIVGQINELIRRINL